MKKGILLSLSSLLLTAATAQNTGDALRYTQTTPLGSARMLGVGNAFTALGADYGTLSLNPAGLAMFRTSEFVLSPGLSLNHSAATLEGADNLTYTRNRGKLNFGSMGFVFHTEPERDFNWKAVNWAIGYNRTANYFNRTYFSGKSVGSLAQHFSEDAQGADVANYDPFGTALAYGTGAIYDTGNDGIIDDDFRNYPDVGVQKAQIINSTGNQGELQLGIAGNFKHRFMLGATIGMPIVNFDESKNYTEEDEIDEIEYFNSLNFKEELITNGIGVNARVGFIYRMTQALRFGLTAQTPSYLWLNDAFNSELTYSYTDGTGLNENTQTSPSGSFKYSLMTPWRFSSGLALLLRDKGFLSLDAEWIDYGGASFNFSNGTNEDIEYELQLNNQIANQFRSAVNVRAGGELTLDRFRLRAGYALNGSPYVDDVNRFYPVYSFGAGLRQRRFYMDFGYRFTNTEDNYSPYPRVDASTQPQVDERFRNGYFLITFGFK